MKRQEVVMIRMLYGIGLLLWFCLSNCGDKKIIIPTEGILPVDSGRLVFDLEFFNTHKYEEGNIYLIYNITHTHVEGYHYYPAKKIYTTVYLPEDSLFGQYYSFYRNCQLRSKGTILTKGEVLVGKEYFYNKKGHIEKIVDHDEKYIYTVDCLFDFMERYELDYFIDIREILKDNYTYVSDVDDRLFPVWVVHTYNEDFFVIDGETGEILFMVDTPGNRLSTQR